MRKFHRTRSAPRTAEFWLKHLDACAKSGLAKAEYGRQNSISVKGLYNWASRANDRAEDPNSKTSACDQPQIEKATPRPSKQKTAVTLVPIPLCRELAGMKDTPAIASPAPSSGRAARVCHDSLPSISICVSSRFFIEIRNDFSSELLAKVVNTLEQIQ